MKSQFTLEGEASYCGKHWKFNSLKELDLLIGYVTLDREIEENHEIECETTYKTPKSNGTIRISSFNELKLMRIKLGILYFKYMEDKPEFLDYKLAKIDELKTELAKYFKH